MSVWAEIAQFLGAITVGSAALAWLAKTLITYWLTTDTERLKLQLASEHARSLEETKSELRRQVDREVENFKADLRVAAYIRETRFAKLQDQRIQVVVDLYRRIVKVDWAFISLMKPLHLVGELDYETKGKHAMEAFNDFAHFYSENRIFFDTNMCKQIDDLSERNHEAWLKFTFWNPAWEHDATITKEAFRARLEAWKSISGDVPKIRHAIEESIRVLIGVVDHH